MEAIGLVSLLVLSVVSGDCSVSGLRFDGLAIRAHEHRGHQTQGTVALGNDVALHVSVVIFAGPDETTGAFHTLRYHVVNETVLIPDFSGIEVLLVSTLEDLLKDVLEPAIVTFQNRVLCRHVQGPLLGQRHLERGVSKVPDTGISIVHGHGHATTTLEIKYLHRDWFTTLWCVYQINRTVSRDYEVRGFVLVTMGVPADDYGLSPSRHESWNGLAQNGFLEDCASEDVTDGSIGGQPHLLQLELCEEK